MAQQVITITTTGQLEGLQHKPGKGLDLRMFGQATVTRASEILWDTTKQKWYVEFRAGANTVLNGVKLTEFMAVLRVGEPVRLASRLEEVTGSPVAYFDEYDEAVAAEINYLNWARASGVLHE